MGADDRNLHPIVLSCHAMAVSQMPHRRDMGVWPPSETLAASRMYLLTTLTVPQGSRVVAMMRLPENEVDMLPMRLPENEAGKLPMGKVGGEGGEVVLAGRQVREGERVSRRPGS